MSEKKEKTKINTEENEKLKTQIDASIGIARSLINSWLPPPKPGEKLDDDDEDDTLTKYSTGRPDRLGLGAKFLSHAEAMRHNNDGGLATKEEILLKNKILNQNRKAASHREAPTPIGKRFRPQDQKSDSSDDDEESRSTTVGTKQHSKKKVKATSTGTTAAPSAGGNKKKIGNQGDFLSMYLSERAGKKKNKK
ncbi:hypothetical protein V8B55DRAFT_1518552, partial [Mucor lusitanicus]|uniref:Uncharacterized protein n=2 Tax=Mucor circinelloides f. lusitanicus TaxID=29924 RepID=A0A162TB34_MUCCL|nr:hypothetical protein FB192DRAFT_1395504 [Mucor lusitanicus]OAD03242.1 hypothetical protein MUCCIDRAFT_81246 [Mucor lusitanicus CBS 277.49]